jgi:hypothetical protein
MNEEGINATGVINSVSDPDPGFGAFLTLASWIRNGKKIQDQGSGMNITNLILRT